MNLDHVMSRIFAPVEQSYDWRDAALYALSLGMGDNPLDEDELLYVFEGRLQQPVPSLCVTLGWPPFWHADPATGIAWTQIVHGEQRFTLHRPLSLQGSIRAEHLIRYVQDKGPGRGALIGFDTEIIDAQTREHLASLHSVQFLRGDGGGGGFGSPSEPLPPLHPEGPPTASFDYSTARQAALFYRLASRDYMPIHADPVVARSAGFERPISHGLNTMGLACRAILKHCAPRRPERLTSMSARFVRPAFPGDTIRVELFADGPTVRFRTRALERDELVLDRGECRLAEL
ncbi:MAG: Acyl dehydratase [Tardiphaga sp.]|jgi:acyl dehydratase|nr:Acyl dehydratase [Tardiphaga sp.]